MHKTVVLNVVGLTSRLIGHDTPFLKHWSQTHRMASIMPLLPAVTCSVQATYLTGKYPETHGIVGNGWYFRDEHEVKFWRQSNQLVQGTKIWEKAKRLDSSFTCANMFWWYNMYSSVDYSVTPRPNYLADGRKIPDVYSYPAGLRSQLQKQLGTFPLFDFWGPKTSIKSSQWIADASLIMDQVYNPTLTLIYLPHLDYNLQRYGIDSMRITKDLQEIDAVCKKLIEYYESMDSRIIVLSEYGITNVNNAISLNRILREKGFLATREEQGFELLDAGASKAFAVADHQIAHIYVNDREKINAVRQIVEQVDGVEFVLADDGKKKHHLDHDRAGELVAVADKDSWFTYYYWMDDRNAPDFARTVDIHRKPGYDPVELFIDPNIKHVTPLIAVKLVKKKLGFRVLMDIIPLDAKLVKGSHGRLAEGVEDRPLFVSNHADYVPTASIAPIDIGDVILHHVGLTTAR